MNMNHAEVDFEISRLRGVCANYRAEIDRLRAALECIAKPTYGTELWMDGEERAEILGGHLFRLQGIARVALRTEPND